MTITVKKFGGSSVAEVELIKAIAHKVAEDYKRGEKLVLVVSAMAKTTDKLFALAHQISRHPSRREMDMLLTAGERISMSLMSLCLMEEDVPSISFTGSQSGIITDQKHGNASILEVNAFRIKEELAKNKVVIVAGFQGVSTSKEITTLGRGGSDTSAVALASYLGAKCCEIYTDVAGVYSADPRVVPQAFLLNEISYLDMLKLSLCGSKVLHHRAVEFALKYKVPLRVKSSFMEGKGTIIKDEECLMEERVLKAIAHKEKLIGYKLPLGDELISFIDNWQDEIFKSYIIDKEMVLLLETKYEQDFVYQLAKYPGLKPVITKDIGFVSLVGLGLGVDNQFMAKLLSALKGQDILRVNSSERSIEIVCKSDDVTDLVRLLHQRFFGENK